MGVIVVVAPDAGGIGSVASVVRNHVRELARTYEVVLISATLPDERITGVKYISSYSPTFVWMHRLGHVPREMAQVHALWHHARQVFRERKVNAAVVHSHALAAWGGWKIKKEYSVPLLLMVHGDIHDRPRGTYDPLVTSFYRWVTPIAYRHVDRILAISNFIAEAAIRHGGDERNVYILPNGIDPSEIGLEDSTLSPIADPYDPVLRLLFVGRLSVEKGFTDLLDACGQLASMKIAFELRVIGDGPLRQRLERQVSDLGLREQITFLGARPRAQLGMHYQWAHITCVPSRSEPQGLVVLESLIAGTPVVGAAVGGIPDIVRDGVNGWVYPGGNADHLARVLNRLATDRLCLAKLKPNRIEITDDYNWRAIGSLLCAYIEELNIYGKR